MSDLINKLRNYPNTIDCKDAALAIEQAIHLLQRASVGDTLGDWTAEVNYWLNTWNNNEEEE